MVPERYAMGEHTSFPLCTVQLSELKRVLGALGQFTSSGVLRSSVKLEAVLYSVETLTVATA